MVTVAVDAYLVLVGLFAGSFINLAADRLPRGESVVAPRSHCRACGRRLNLVDLLPVGGYVVRGGRCATCRAPIGISAPLVEAVCAACVAVPLLWQGLWPGAATGLSLVLLYGVSATALAIARARREPRPGTPNGSWRPSR